MSCRLYCERSPSHNTSRGRTLAFPASVEVSATSLCRRHSDGPSLLSSHPTTHTRTPVATCILRIGGYPGNTLGTCLSGVLHRGEVLSFYAEKQQRHPS